MGRWRWILLTALATLLLLPLAATAHGGGISRLADVESGPYRLFVWTSPDPARVGSLHVTVAVTQAPDARTGFADPVLNADVELRLSSGADSGPPLVVPATHLNAANPFYYEADLEVPTAGLWQATVTARGLEGVGSAGFDLQVLPALVIGWQWALVGALALLVLMGLAGFVYGGSASNREMRHDLQRTL